MNYIALSGTVYEPQMNKGTASFNLSVYRGKDEDPKYFTIRVKIFKCKMNLRKGMKITVFGRLDTYKYNDKYYTEVLCNNLDCGEVSDEQPDYIPYP